MNIAIVTFRPENPHPSVRQQKSRALQHAVDHVFNASLSAMKATTVQVDTADQLTAVVAQFDRVIILSKPDTSCEGMSTPILWLWIAAEKSATSYRVNVRGDHLPQPLSVGDALAVDDTASEAWYYSAFAPPLLAWEPMLLSKNTSTVAIAVGDLSAEETRAASLESILHAVLQRAFAPDRHLSVVLFPDMPRADDKSLDELCGRVESFSAVRNVHVQNYARFSYASTEHLTMLKGFDLIVSVESDQGVDGLSIHGHCRFIGKQASHAEVGFVELGQAEYLSRRDQRADTVLIYRDELVHCVAAFVDDDAIAQPSLPALDTPVREEILALNFLPTWVNGRTAWGDRLLIWQRKFHKFRMEPERFFADSKLPWLAGPWRFFKTIQDVIRSRRRAS